MAKRIINKTVGGRQYRYERISTKRQGGKVVTMDKYLGPVGGVKGGRIEQAPAKTQQGLKKLYQAGYPVDHLVKRLKDQEGIGVCGSTMRNYMKREGHTPQTDVTR